MALSKRVQQVVCVIRDLQGGLGRMPSQEEIQAEVLHRNNGERACGNDTIVKAKKYLQEQERSYLTADRKGMEDFGRDVVTLLLSRLGVAEGVVLDAVSGYGILSKKMETISSLLEGLIIDTADEGQLRKVLGAIQKEIDEHGSN